jgi:hypothetical protein
MNQFSASRLKVKWAHKHIENSTMAVRRWLSSDFYAISVKKKRKVNYVSVVITKTFPADLVALYIGDALHNLRSALDILYFQICTKTTKWTRFPVRDSREELESTLSTALKKQQISSEVFEHILETVKPYKDGNLALWALDDMNIIDKHQLLIPVLQFVEISGVRLKDEKGSFIDVESLFPFGACLSDGSPYDVSVIDQTGYRNKAERLTFEQYCSASIAIGFQDPPFCGQPILPTLNGIAEEVSRTIESFAILLGGK